ncbi:MAG: MazG family protein [Propionibacteriaceae bacterium]
MSTQPERDATEVRRLVEVVDRLRVDCPWDAEQTHRSLVPYLLEESYEVVEAIENLPGTTNGTDGPDPNRHDHLVEELGDLLLQVIFHVVIAAEADREVTMARVAAGIADKLVTRHPHVFAGEEVGAGTSLADLDASWEARKAVEKGRRSVLEGIPDLPSLARATKIISRSRARGVPVPLAPRATQGTVGEQILALVAEAHTAGVDPDQSLRDALRGLEARVRATETAPPGSPDTKSS